MGINTSTPSATTGAEGTIKLAGQLGGTSQSPTVAGVTGAVVTVANLANGTAGQIPTWDAAGVAAAVATGTATHVLTSNGAGAAPTFQAAAGGSGQTLYDAIVAASGGDYTTLGAAITAAAAGDTIFVRSGTYTESAITSSTANLTIIGENPETTVISMGVNGFSLTGAYAHLEKLKMTFTSGEINLSGANQEVVGCHFSKTGAATSGMAFSSNDILVTDCYFTDTTTTTTVSHWAFLGDRPRIDNNYFYVYAHTTAVAGSTIYVGGTHAYFTNNTVKWNTAGTGSLVGFANFYKTVTGNTFIDTSVTAQLVNCAANTAMFTGNTFQGGAIGVVLAAGNTFTGNSFRSTIDAVRVNGAQCVISGNKIEGNATTSGYLGIEVLATMDDTIITGNSINTFDVGISVAASTCDRTVINANKFIGCTTNISDSGTTTTVSDDQMELRPVDVKKYTRMKNTSGFSLVAGDLVTRKAVAAGDEVTTSVTVGDPAIFGMATATIANNAYGYIQALGKTVALKVDGNTDIAIGDYITQIGTANYTTGTALFTNASAAVVGTGTTFTAAMVGMKIKNDANATWYTISAVTDATNLTLSIVYAGTTTTSDAYTITAAGVGVKATAGTLLAVGDTAIAVALEAYTTNDAAGVIDALIIEPRKI